MLSEKRGRGSDDLALFVVVNGAGSRCKAVLISKPYFGKYQAVAVLHNEIDFTHSATKICGYFS
jgi:hypothetical protein